MSRIEHTDHPKGKTVKDCPACKLEADAAKAVRALEGAARAAERAQSKQTAERQRALYDSAPKWGDAA